MAKKKEEVRRMKALKMKELRQKLEQIGREGGVEIDTGGQSPQSPDALLLNRNYVGLIDLDLDGDWDPEKHDRQMAGLYNDEEYEEVRILVLSNRTRIIIFLCNFRRWRNRNGMTISTLMKFCL